MYRIRHSPEKRPRIFLRKLENVIMVVAVCLHAIDLIEELSNFSSLSVAPFDAFLHMVLRSERKAHGNPRAAAAAAVLFEISYWLRVDAEITNFQHTAVK